MQSFFQEYTTMMGFSGGHDVLWAIMILWSLAWKGVALWKAARNNEKYWYVGLLVINTVGILEILYVFFFSKRKQQES